MLLSDVRILSACALALLPVSATATVSSDCASVDGQYSIDANLQPGDVVSMPRIVSQGSYGIPVGQWNITNVATGENHSFYEDGQSFTIQQAGRYRVTEWSGVYHFAIHCTPAAAVSGIKASNLSRVTATTTLTTALDHVADLRFDHNGNGTGTAVSRDAGFLSTATSGQGTYHAWSHLTARRINGGNLQEVASLSFGLDKETVPGTYLGLLVQHVSLQQQIGTTEEQIDATSVGSYFGTRLGAAELGGYVTFGQPLYRLSTDRFRSRRAALGLRLRSKHVRGTLAYQPFFGFSASQEKLPAYASGSGIIAAQKHSHRSLEIGTRITWAPASPATWIPFAIFAVESVRNETRLGHDEFVAARIGVGVTAHLAENGQARFHVERGRTSSDARDLSLHASVNLNF